MQRAGDVQNFVNDSNAGSVEFHGGDFVWASHYGHDTPHSMTLSFPLKMVSFSGRSLALFLFFPSFLISF